MWDTMYYMTFGSYRRDEGIAAIILKVLFRFVVNLTMGLIMAVIQFLFSIWQVCVRQKKMLIFPSTPTIVPVLKAI